MKVGGKVMGIYYGVRFTGVLLEARRLTVKTDGCFEYTVALDNPLTVFGNTWHTLLMYACFDGTPSSYTDYTCSIQEYEG